MPVASSRRRFFIRDGRANFQIFTFAQSKRDASIYVASPAFSRIRWLTFPKGAKPGTPLAVPDSPGDGKLSFHGSGEAHVRGHDTHGERRLVIRGNFLKNDGKNTLGVRHLFTTLITKPEHCPDSPAFNRASDYCLQASRLVPYVMTFWAVPAVRKLTVGVMAAFCANELETVPPESGWGSFGLALHSVVWFAYRTKHMERWPAESHICYHDGYFVPVMIGIQEGVCRVELRTPKYMLSETELHIAI